MAIRRWLVRPDREIELPDGGLLGIVSREAFVDAVLDAVSMVDRAGGGFTVFSSRYPTDVEHEMVTTGVLVEWRDRTDAKPQPERPSETPRAEVPDGVDPELVEDMDVIADAAAPTLDGLDESALPEEDLSEVPEHVR